eukprot:Sspe_Gene.92941::Locus_65687_Transcript_1_1_Confidence_1.000_Length_2306::g.92941::m.92941
MRINRVLVFCILLYVMKRVAERCLTVLADKRRRRSEGPWEAVVDFWFRSLPIKSAQKQLWFSPAGSEAQREADQAIADSFGTLLDEAERDPDGVYSSWTERGGVLGQLGFVILIDQMARHIHRHRKEDINLGAERVAYKATKDIIASDDAWQELTPVQLVFSLLPLRHDKAAGDVEEQKANHRLALDTLDRIEGCLGEMAGVASRFRTATVRRYQALCDIAPLGAEICEREEFQPPPEVAARLPREGLVRSMAWFLVARAEALKANGGVVCVSLSGGVDSMVIADILVHLRDHPDPVDRSRRGDNSTATEKRMRHDVLKAEAKGLVRKVVAIHIDYGNRHESAREAEFVEDWCRRRNIVFHKRVIEEVKRGTTQRDEYEKVTREARYGTYRRVLEEEGGLGVCLGHHADDIVENLLSNATKGCGVLDLSGMKQVGTVEGVSVWRPLLGHVKQEIFDYAHTYGVPYFKDTTPTWSTRGKLRRNLLPCLADTYGEGSMGNLRNLAKESDMLQTLVTSHVIEPFLSAAVHRGPAGAVVTLEGYRTHGKLFWKEVLRHLMHDVFGTPMLGEKSLIEFGLRVGLKGFEIDADVPPSKDGWVEVRKGLLWYLCRGQIFMLTPRLSARPPPRGPASLSLPHQPPVTIDGFEITADELREGEYEFGDHRAKDHRALPNVCRTPPWSAPLELIDGAFEYCTVVPEAATELPELSNKDGPLLPHAWRQVPVKYREILPIFAPPEKCPPTTRRVVRVKYRYVGRG